jgi:hypothetical protein
LPAIAVIFFTPFGQRLVGAEDRGVGLHGLLHFQPQVGGRHRALGVRMPVEAVQRLVDLGLVVGGIARLAVDDLAGADRGGAAKDHKVDQAVRAQPVRAMDRGAARLAHRHQAGEGASGLRGRVQHLAPIVRRDAAHVVMHGRQHRDRLR